MSSSAPLRVGLDVSAIPLRLTGVGHYVTDLLKALARRDDVCVTALVRHGDAARWTEAVGAADDVVECAPSNRIARVAFGTLLLGVAQRRRAPGVEVFHGPHYGLPRLLRVPGVVTIHDLTLVDHPEWHERAKVAFFGAEIHHAARAAAAVVCLTNHDAARFTEIYRPRGEVFVVPHGIDHELFSPEEPFAGADEERLRRLGVTSPFIAHVGTVEPRKNLPTLVAAFDRLAPNDDDLTLVLAGTPGWGSAALEEAIGRSPYPGRVVRLGHVDDADIPALYRRASVVAYASLAEGFGMPVLEALATGAPVVTSEGSVMDSVAAGTAIAVAPNDVEALAEALLVAARGGPGAESRRQAGIDRAAEFTWDASAAGHLAAWRSVTR